jgi:hypothetical protein
MVDVEYYSKEPPRVIYTEERAAVVPVVGDEVCLPPDDDPANEFEGGWHAFEVVKRRYVPSSEHVVCYVED